MKIARCILGILAFACASATVPTFAQTAPSIVQVPSKDVPEKCAVFSGAWSGEWPYNGRLYLWVVSIEPDCKAQVIYGKNAKPSATAKRTEAKIKDNSLILPRPDGGTTTFEIRSDVLSAHYSGPAGTNDATMQRLDLGTVDQLVAEQKRLTAMVPLAPDVPAACAAFFGQWVGKWSVGNFGDQYLRVVEVTHTGEKCVARYSYTPSKSPVPAKDTVEIAKGEMSFVCNPSTGGTCVFEPHSDELYASYSNSSGGRNNGVFKKIP